MEQPLTIQPLQWPEYWLKPDALQRFLKGMPWIGIDKKTRRDINRQLRLRPVDLRNAWPTRLQPYHDLVSQLVEEYMIWVDTRFIPQDPCAILFFDPSWELRSAELMAVLEDRYGHDLFDEPFPSLTYGELIERIADRNTSA